MKKTSYFKGALLLVTMVTPILLITSCGNNQNRDESGVAKDQNEAYYNDNRATDAQFLVNNEGDRNRNYANNDKQKSDSLFLVSAAEISLEQIQLGQLAQQNGTSTHVKELGKKMEDAHTKSLNDLTALADRKMVTIPTTATDDAKDDYKKLNEKRGNDFDKEYADMMVSRHKDAIDTYEKAWENGNDTDIKNWANTSMADLRKHLDLSVECQKKCEKL